MTRPRIVFFGTPHFAASSLGFLLDHGIEVVAVVTRPDRPKGRSSQATPSAVKELMQARAPHIPIFTPEKASDPEFLEELAKIGADLFVVVVYGQILPQKLLDIPPKGCINTHPSLLPRHRGPTPIQWAILSGDTETGVTIQKMARKVDSGAILAQVKTALPHDMLFGDLEAHLLELSKPLLLSVIKAYETGEPPSREQDENFVTFCSKIDPAKLKIDWTLSATDIHNMIRAFSPKPGAWTIDGGKRLKILKSQVVESQGKDTIACGDGFLRILEVQPEGKKAMSALDYLRGQKNEFRL